MIGPGISFVFSNRMLGFVFDFRTFLRPLLVRFFFPLVDGLSSSEDNDDVISLIWAMAMALCSSNWDA